MDLIPDQLMYPVPLGKAFNEVFFVLPYPLDEIRGHADIESAIGFTGQDVDTRHFGTWGHKNILIDVASAPLPVN